MRQHRTMLVAGMVALLGAVNMEAAEPTPGLPATLRVLTAADEMPEMFSFDPSGPPGLERELIEGFCRIHDLRLESVPVADFEQIIPMLERGEGDVITGIVDTPARRERIAFTREVFPMRHLVVTRRPNAPVARAEALRDLQVGIIPGTSWEAVVIEEGVPSESRLPFADAEMLLAGLRDGEVDAVVMALFDFALAQKRDAALTGGAFVGPNGSAAFGVRRDDAQLLDALNAYLDNTRQSRLHLMFRYLTEDALSLIAVARRE